MPSFFCLVNPLSGGGAGLKLLPKLQQLSTVQRPIEACFIDFDGLPSQLEQARTFERLIIAGGDGTFSSVLAKLPSAEMQVGVVPLGTGNDLGRALGVMKLKKRLGLEGLIDFYSAANAKSVQMWNVQYGENFANQRAFINYLSFGYDAEVVSRFAEARKGVLNFLHHFGRPGNRFGYFLCGLSLLHRLFSSSGKILTSRTEVDHACSIFFANIQEVMGLGVSNDIGSPFDSLLECRVIKNITDYFSFLGLGGGREGSTVQFGEYELEIKSPFVAQVDGESWIKDESSAENRVRFKIKPGPRVNLLC